MVHCQLTHASLFQSIPFSLPVTHCRLSLFKKVGYSDTLWPSAAWPHWSQSTKCWRFQSVRVHVESVELDSKEPL